MVNYKIMMAGAAMLCAASLPCLAQPFAPGSAVKIVVPTPPGGASDTSARILAEGLQALWKQPVVVENKTGASGTIGATFVSRAAPDGHTLFFGTGSTHVVAPLMLAEKPYDPERDFTPLAVVGFAPFVLFARSDLPADNLRDLVKYIRDRKPDLSFGTSGPATIYEVAARLLEIESNARFNHIPYKGLAPMAMDVAAGRVDLGVGPVDGYLKNPKLKVLAVLGDQRVAAWPDTPTSKESGHPAFTVPVWAAIWGPPGLSGEAQAGLTHDLLRVLQQPAVQQKIVNTGIIVQAGDGQALRNLIGRDLEALQAVLKAQARP